MDSNVDLPTLGNPTRPTSANSLSSSVTSISSPGSPFSLKSGAGLRGDAKRELPRPPRPPLAITALCLCSTRSANTSPSSTSLTIVPGGTCSTRSSAFLPCMLLLWPLSPFLALK